MSVNASGTREEIGEAGSLLCEAEGLIVAIHKWVGGTGSREELAFALVGVMMAGKRFRNVVGAERYDHAKAQRVAEFFPEVKLLGPGWRKEDLPI